VYTVALLRFHFSCISIYQNYVIQYEVHNCIMPKDCTIWHCRWLCSS